MQNYMKNILKKRLDYCKNWENAVNVYLANIEINKKTNNEFYKNKKLLRVFLSIYFIPYNFIKFVSNLKLIYEYQKNIKEIKVLEQELERYENYR